MLGPIWGAVRACSGQAGRTGNNLGRLGVLWTSPGVLGARLGVLVLNLGVLGSSLVLGARLGMQGTSGHTGRQSGCAGTNLEGTVVQSGLAGDLLDMLEANLGMIGPRMGSAWLATSSYLVRFDEAYSI